MDEENHEYPADILLDLILNIFSEYFNHLANARSFVESMFVMLLSQERLALKDDGVLAQAKMLLGGNAVELFDESHKTHQYRYIKVGEYERRLCSLPILFDWFSTLDSVIAEAVSFPPCRARSGAGWKFPEDKPDWRISHY